MDHLLSALLAVPLAGLAVLLTLPSSNSRLLRFWALAVATAELGISLLLAARFDPARGIQFLEQASWIPSLGAQYLLGIDGMGLAFVLLTTVVIFLALLSSWAAIREREKEYYAWFLLLESAVIGSFISLDLLLFFFCFEIVLVPIYFLIALWGGERRQMAAMKFFLYTVLGSVLLLLGILALHQQHFAQTGQRTFALLDLLRAPLPPDVQFWIFWAFFFGFAVKIPMFPFHTWLPDAHTEAPTAGSVVLAALLLKMGTYGLMRFSLPLFPDAARSSAGLIAALSIIAIVYGALVSLMQKDWKRLVAYSSVSHMGFCTLGMFAFTPGGLSGSLLQQINHGIASALLFLIVGVVYERTGTRLIADIGGLSKRLPVLAVFFLISILSSMGMPPLNGFVGEIVLLQGIYAVSPVWAAWAVLGILLGAAYLIWLYQRTMFGTIQHPALTDLTAREILTMVPLLAAVFWIGIHPAPLLRWFEQPVSLILGSR